jgi:hypothetical protein
MFLLDSTVSQAAITDDPFTKYSQTNNQELVYLDNVIGSGEIEMESDLGKTLAYHFDLGQAKLWLVGNKD